MNLQMREADEGRAKAVGRSGMLRRRLPAGHRARSAGARGMVLGAAAVASLLLSSEYPQAGQEPSSRQYSIKSSEVAPPHDAKPGQYRRIIQPFPNWTLICDENLTKKQRVCNITQTIVDQTGAMAFSWSLAATASGQPIMIMRVPPQVGKGGPLQISFSGGKTSVNPVHVKTGDCDQSVCLTLLPVGAVLRDQINKQADTQITYSNPTVGGSAVVVNTTFKGLPAALAAIR